MPCDRPGCRGEGQCGVPPQLERHMKMQAVLDQGNDDAVREAITAAYEMQRR